MSILFARRFRITVEAAGRLDGHREPDERNAKRALPPPRHPLRGEALPEDARPDQRRDDDAVRRAPGEFRGRTSRYRAAPRPRRGWHGGDG